MAVEWVELSVVIVCLSVFLHVISKTDAARITESTYVFHDESWKPFVLGSKVMVMGHKKQRWCGLLHSFECWLFLVFFLVLPAHLSHYFCLECENP